MTRTTRTLLGAALAGAIAVGLWSLRRAPEAAPPPALSPGALAPSPPQPAPPPIRPTPPAGASVAADDAEARRRAIAALIARIEADYHEVRGKAAADYAAAGKSFPGGLNAFLRQLALLEREKRADLAKELTPRELEDYEYRETNAGQQVARLLGDTGATEAQRRAAFRHQLAFEDRFALVFDMAPAALAEREAARQATQENIRGELGDALFAAWLRGEGAEFGQMAELVATQGQPVAAALDLWSARNEFIRGRLRILADPALDAAQRQAAVARLAEQAEIRVASVVGLAALQAGRDEALQWLRKP